MSQEKLQELFNKGYLGVIAQGEPSKTGVSCIYFKVGESGEVLRCMVGHMMTEEHAINCCRYGSIDSFYEQIAPFLGLDPRERQLNVWHLAQLQRCHDDNPGVGSLDPTLRISTETPWLEAFKKRCQHFARVNGLQVPHA
jgi:hypothetical protein